MQQPISRLRMFAGPNGSGKSTIKSVVPPQILGIYINPDEIEDNIRKKGFLDFHAFEVSTTRQELFDFFKNSELLNIAHMTEESQTLRFANNKLFFDDVQVNAYYASVASDFIRHQLIKIRKSFSFETVMSSPDKVKFIQKAQQESYRTYLYYVATEDPEINISRVRHRVKMGGHDVPEDKIVSRYYRSIDLLLEAVRNTDRAYIFDNSSHEHIWLAEITNGNTIQLKVDRVPSWFKKGLLDKIDFHRALYSGTRI